MRVGSLSTRTVHPRYIGLLQAVLDGAGLTVKLSNPYRFRTKGEMLSDCKNQDLLTELAVQSTSCGRYQRHGYKHCGRCVPCQIRRAAFVRWGQPDESHYHYEQLGLHDEQNANFDDVRSVVTALNHVTNQGLTRWLGATLASVPPEERDETEKMLERGIRELKALHNRLGVK